MLIYWKFSDTFPPFKKHYFFQYFCSWNYFFVSEIIFTYCFFWFICTPHIQVRVEFLFALIAPICGPFIVRRTNEGHWCWPMSLREWNRFLGSLVTAPSQCGCGAPTKVSFQKACFELDRKMYYTKFCVHGKWNFTYFET